MAVATVVLVCPSWQRDFDALHELSLSLDEIIRIVNLPRLDEAKLLESSDLVISHYHPHGHLVEAVSLDLEVAAYACDLLLDVYRFNVGLNCRANVAWQLKI